VLYFPLEPISKIGFWFKIPSSPKGFAGTRAAGPSFPALLDSPHDYVEDLKRGTNKDIGPKDIFEIGSNIFYRKYPNFPSDLIGVRYKKVAG
jgi:hypothetical protein